MAADSASGELDIVNALGLHARAAAQLAGLVTEELEATVKAAQQSQAQKGRNPDAASIARKTISFEPPPAGITPTPTSTNPM